MRRKRRFIPERGSLCHSESMLLVDDAESKVLENHSVFNQSVRPDDDLQIATCEVGEDLFSLRLLGASGEQGEVHIHAFELCSQCLKMLSSKDFRRSHERRLIAVIEG